MTNEEKLIKDLVRLVDELAREASYVDNQCFTADLGRQNYFVRENSSVSYRDASSRLSKILANYYVAKDKECPYSVTINRIIKQRRSRVVSL